MLLKQSTARSAVVFMTDTSDHIAGKTGLTLTITASKDGGSFATITPTVTELANGWYKLALTTSHTDTLGDLALHITGTGADPTDLVRQVVADLPGATVSSVTGAVGSVTGAVGSVTGSVGSVTGAVASVTGNVGGNVVGSVASVTARVTANTDQLAGQTVTAAAGVTFPASVASPTNITAGTITTVTNLTNAATAGDLTATMKTSVTTAATAATPTAAAVSGAVGSVTGNVGGNVTGSVASVVGAVGSVTGNVGGNVTGSIGSLATQAKADVNAEADAALSDVGVTTTVTGRIDAAITTRLATAGYTAPDNADVLLIKAVTDKLGDTLEADGSPQNYRFTTHALAQAPSGGGGSAPTVQQIVDGVLDELIAGHLDAGSVGAAISDAGAAGNPWNNTAEGSYTFGDLVRILAGVMAGKTTIVSSGAGGAAVTFRDVSDASNIVSATMSGSERVAVTLAP